MMGIASWRFRIVWQRQAKLGDGSVAVRINHRLGLRPRRCHASSEPLRDAPERVEWDGK